MRQVVIDNGIVINAVIAPSGWAPESGLAIASDTAQVGWLYDGKTFTPPAPPAVTPDQLLGRANMAQSRVLADGQMFNVAASGSPAKAVLCDGLQSTLADLGWLESFGQKNPTGTRSWVDNKGIVTSLTGAELVTLSTDVGTWRANTFDFMGSVIAEIKSGAITTIAQIDALTWPSASA